MPWSNFARTPSEASFGSYPTQEELKEIEQSFDLIINLVNRGETGCDPYEINIPTFFFPIKDNSKPNNWLQFSVLIIKLCSFIKGGMRVFIHCRGGHGRSGMVAAAILCYLYGEHPEHALRKISDIHSTRSGLSIRWKKKFHPLSTSQRIFVYQLFAPLFFTKTTSFSTISSYEIIIDGITFKNVEEAFQYERYGKQICAITNRNLIKIISDEKGGTFDEDITFSIMKQIHSEKYIQHPSLLEYLFYTRLNSLQDACKVTHANNLIGRVLMSLRDSFVRQHLIV